MKDYQKHLLEKFKKMEKCKLIFWPRCTGKKLTFKEETKDEKIQKLYGTNAIGIIFDDEFNWECRGKLPIPVLSRAEFFEYSADPLSSWDERTISDDSRKDSQSSSS